MDKANLKMNINILGHKIRTNSKGQLHNEYGPAFEWQSGAKYWYKEGNLHRLDGSAIEYSNGNKCWYINHIHFSKEEFNSWILRIRKCI